jgi:AcrR family transcriptional regulator
MVQTNDLIKSTGTATPGKAGKPKAMRVGRPRRGDSAEGRNRLLKAATRLFADKGLDGVSTRELAAEAGVNLSAITYHFGGKEKLYKAALQYVIDLLAPRRQQVIDALGASVRAAKGDPALLSAVSANFVRAMFTALTNPEFPVEPVRLLIRELHQPTKALELVMAGHINPVQDAITDFVAAATGRSADDEDAKLLGFAVTHQVLMPGLMRPVIQARLGWQQFTPARTDKIINATILNVQRLLQLPETGTDDQNPKPTNR